MAVVDAGHHPDAVVCLDYIGRLTGNANRLHDLEGLLVDLCERAVCRVGDPDEVSAGGDPARSVADRNDLNDGDSDWIDDRK